MNLQIPTLRLQRSPKFLRIPKGFRNKAQGCRACEATLGLRRLRFTTLKGLRPARAVRWFMEKRTSYLEVEIFLEFWIWVLGFLWCLDLGAWSFPGACCL